MKILIDCDVLLDVMDGRKPHVEFSGRVLDACEAGMAGAVAWHTLSNAAYLTKDPAAARQFFTDLLGFISVPGTDTAAALAALRYPMKDFEDAMQAASAEKFSADWIVTRNVKDFKGSPVPAISPEDFCRRQALA
jgi:predicted nucleic acid-binding protein